MSIPTPSRSINLLSVRGHRPFAEHFFGMVGPTWTEVERECRLSIFEAFCDWSNKNLERFRVQEDQGAAREKERS